MKPRVLLFLLLTGVFSLSLFAQEATVSPWRIRAEGIDRDNYYGITCANGVIGLVSSPNPMQVQDVVLNGVYDNYQRGRVSNILKTFNHLNVELEVDGVLVSLENISAYQQELDMQTATLETSFEAGQKIRVRNELMALRQLPYSALSVLTITAEEDVTITARSVIEAPSHLRDVRNFFAEIVRPHVSIPLLTSVAESPTGELRLAASTTFLLPEAHDEQPHIAHIDWDFNRHWMTFTKALKAGQTYRFAVLGSTLSSEQYDDPQNEVERLTIWGALEGLDKVVRQHRAAWAELWQSDIVIEGDPQAQQDVRSMLYHLYSFSRAGTAYSLSPMGLSGLGYNGHVFWDTEIWMFPPLLLLQPDIARSLLEYRFERLEAARQNAFAHGFRGLMFPWESADDGAEDTPVWALTGPFQHHISGDVAWAFWKYYQVTKDETFLRSRAWPVLKEVADFWVSRVDRNDSGQYDIKNVIGANEYEENVDNNAFTNGMAKTVLGYATEAARLLGYDADPEWQEVASNIPILKFEDGTTRENATYNGAIIKQADVNLLAYPLKIVHEKEAVRRDLDYYEAVMDPKGPAMGISILAILHARLGDESAAYRNFKKSYEPNKVPPFGVLAETAGGTNPYFATGAGGTLQVVLNGFGGLDITDNGIEQLKTNLPKHWKKLTIKGVGRKNKTFIIEN